MVSAEGLREKPQCRAGGREAACRCGGATSPGDRTREKIPFYARLGVVELLLLDREAWTLELHRRQGARLERVGQSSAATGEVLSCASVPLSLQLVPGTPRPRIAVTDTASGRSWSV